MFQAKKDNNNNKAQLNTEQPNTEKFYEVQSICQDSEDQF